MKIFKGLNFEKDMLGPESWQNFFNLTRCLHSTIIGPKSEQNNEKLPFSNILPNSQNFKNCLNFKKIIKYSKIFKNLMSKILSKLQNDNFRIWRLFETFRNIFIKIWRNFYLFSKFYYDFWFVIFISEI